MAEEHGEFSDIRELLAPNERIEAQATQRRWGPGGDLTTPITLIATDQKLIIINRTRLGMRKDYEIVQYANVVGTKMIHGFISSSIIIRIRGYKITTKNNKDEIDGFVSGEAKSLVDYVNRRIGSTPGAAQAAQAAASAPQTNGTGQDNGGIKISPRGDIEYCPSCGARNIAGSKFCSSCGKKM
ncbi:MAG: zinc ribbon domain-containing protein [Candidatus Micrarchaeota archaeon]|nr:zinc ribbon domain-containing protein [Candidatus Micrarchaeota archaeon]